MSVSVIWAHALKTPFPSVWFNDILNTDLCKWHITLLHRAHNHFMPKNLFIKRVGEKDRFHTFYSPPFASVILKHRQAYGLHTERLHDGCMGSVHVLSAFTCKFLHVPKHTISSSSLCTPEWVLQAVSEMGPVKAAVLIWGSFGEGIPLAPIPCLKNHAWFPLLKEMCGYSHTTMHKNRVGTSCQPAHFFFPQNSSRI